MQSKAPAACIKAVNQDATARQSLHFRIIPEERRVFRDTIEVKLSKQLYDILWTLLQAEGAVVEKDRLIEQVWGRRIVTDAALMKQITRLRQALGPEAAGDAVIETVRGVGYRWVPAVRPLDQHPGDAFGLPNRRTAWVMGLLLVLLAVPLLMWLQPTTDPVNDKTDVQTEPVAQAVRLAVMPSQAGEDWINVGGLKWLAGQLQQNNRVHAMAPLPQWFSGDDPELESVRWTRDGHADRALLLHLKQTNDRFTADVALRDADAVQAKTQLTADSLSALLEKVRLWTLRHLNVEALAGVDRARLQTSEFALESFLRAFQAVQQMHLTEAVDFMQVAVREDEHFYPAWISLAELHAALGEQDKARGITDMLNGVNNLSTSERIRLLSNTAYVRMLDGEFDAAQNLLNQAIGDAEANGDMHNLMKALSTLTILHQLQDRMDEETLALIERELALVLEFQPVPSRVAELTHNLAVLNAQLNRPQSATELFTQALSQFTALDHQAGVLSCQSNLANLEIIQGRPLAALQRLQALSMQALQTQHEYTYIESRLVQFQALMAAGWRERGLLQLTELIESTDRQELRDIRLRARRDAVLYESQYARLDSAQQQLNALRNEWPQDDATLPGYWRVELALLHSHLHLQQAALDAARPWLDQLRDADENAFTPDQAAHWLQIQGEWHVLHGEHATGRALLQQARDAYLALGQVDAAAAPGWRLLASAEASARVETQALLQQLMAQLDMHHPALIHQAAQHFSHGQSVQALALMHQAKQMARDFWRPQDQLQLEAYQRSAQ